MWSGRAAPRVFGCPFIILRRYRIVWGHPVAQFCAFWILLATFSWSRESRGTSKSEDLTVKAIPAFDRGIFLVFFKSFLDFRTQNGLSLLVTLGGLAPQEAGNGISQIFAKILSAGALCSPNSLSSRSMIFLNNCMMTKALNWKILSWEKSCVFENENSPQFADHYFPLTLTLHFLLIVPPFE